MSMVKNNTKSTLQKNQNREESKVSILDQEGEESSESSAVVTVANPKKRKLAES